MIGLAGFLFVAAGVGGLIGELYYGSFAYGIRLPVSLLLAIVWLIVGIGLWLRKASARVVALGVYLAGSFAVLILIVYVVVNRHELGNALGLVFYIALHLHERMPRLLPAIPVAIALFALIAVVGSLISWWFYRYFMRPEVAAEFGASGAHRGAVWGIAAAYLVMVHFSSATLTVRQDQLPAFAQSKVYKDSRKASAQRDLQERAQFLAMMVGQLYFSADGGSMVAATHSGAPELFFFDTGSGAIARKDPKLYRVETGSNEPDALPALLSADQRLFLAKSSRQVVDTRTDQARAIDLPHGWFVPLGFGAQAASLLYFVPASGKLEVLDHAANRIVFSADATRAEWLADDFQRQELRRALRSGAWSPARGHFAYVFRGRLHMLQLAQGGLEIDERPVPDGSQPTFAREGDALILTVNGAIGQPPLPGVVYLLADRSLQPHAIRPPVHYFSTAEGRILSYGVDHVAEHSMQNLLTPRRRLPLPQYASYAISADGRYLVLKARTKVNAEFGDLLASTTDMPVMVPLLTKLSIGEAYVQLAGGPGRVALVSGPSIEIVSAEAFTGAGGTSAVHDLSRLSEDPRLKPAGKP